MDRIIATVDPGKNGAIVFYGKDTFAVYKYKEPSALSQLLDQFDAEIKEVYFEQVNSFRGEMESNPGKAMAMQGLFERTNVHKGIFIANGWMVHSVNPRTWQKTCRLPSIKGETDTSKKNRYKERAQRIFQKVKVTKWNSDALLILYHVIRK